MSGQWEGPLDEHDAPHAPLDCEYCGAVSNPTRHNWFRFCSGHQQVADKPKCWVQQLEENHARMAAEQQAKKRRPVRPEEPVQLDLLDLLKVAA